MSVHPLESNDLRLSRTKIKYLKCKFIEVVYMVHEADVKVRLDTQAISMRDSFKYLESIFQKNGKIDEDVTQYISVGA